MTIKPSVVAAVLVSLVSLGTGPAVHAAGLLDPLTGILDPVVSGNELSASIVLPGGISAEIVIAFEDVHGLSVESLGLSAQLFLPLLDPSAAARLPAGVSPATALPLLIVIDPPPGGGLSFHGLPVISLHTELLSYSIGTPLRLFAADPGEVFRDVTAYEGPGSFRVGGSKPEFAGHYVILSDVRPLNDVLFGNLVWLEEVLSGDASLIDPPVLSQLGNELADVRQAIEEDRPADAAVLLDAFTSSVGENSGAAIPDLWRAERDRVNVAGDLRAVAATLRFDLKRAVSQ